ncbi:SKP1-like protein 20 isoform X3 [Cynara cardunculus var. scolymus]|uniref:SKP1-like protein 20 isoform X3 n=1 Tax=Cynara cardunculus var. scolymus TaxID=59895 RepID=UPI000D626FAE|nr:SKP1-like protein 20 isoform X3 [Cynara cardunculus var. scolymus]XP_024996042.1 SKP1-like protein 20 isoform X3 [Cynara cardunculus var. scolymus]XP_024996043.1 SKP1-like protein 20 isoform X3 [Cynara cardunculus var. scolymus]
MSGSDISKRQMKKSYIWLQTSDGSIEQVEQDMILFSSFIHHMMHAGMGSSKTRPIALPSSVTPIILGVILGYFRFHRLPGRSDLERKFFDEKFFRMETRRLYELTASAYTLQMAPLVELCCDALARQIEGKSIEEIRQALGLPDDTTEEERWKTIKIAPNDPQVRLLNKLHAKKMKEKEKMVAGPWFPNVKDEAPHADHRSIDELLSFINGENGESKEAQPSKNKKKHHKGKNKQKKSPSVCTISDGCGHSNNAGICMP